jgi:hypothetical protein
METNTDIFMRIKAVFPPSYRDDCWYTVTVRPLALTSPTSSLHVWVPPAKAVSIVACHRQHSLGEFYLHLIRQPEFQTPEQRQRLSKRIHAAMMKAWPLIGIPLVFEAVASLAKVERDEDIDPSFDQYVVPLPPPGMLCLAR